MSSGDMYAKVPFEVNKKRKPLFNFMNDYKMNLSSLKLAYKNLPIKVISLSSVGSTCLLAPKSEILIRLSFETRMLSVLRSR